MWLCRKGNLPQIKQATITPGPSWPGTQEWICGNTIQSDIPQLKDMLIFLKRAASYLNGMRDLMKGDSLENINDAGMKMSFCRFTFIPRKIYTHIYIVSSRKILWTLGQAGLSLEP
jgi:hypothetical protein